MVSILFSTICKEYHLNTPYKPRVMRGLNLCTDFVNPSGVVQMFSKELLINRPKAETKNSFLCTIEVVKGSVSGGRLTGTKGYGASNDSVYPFGSVTVDSDYPPVCYFFYTGVNENNGTLNYSEYALYGTFLSFYDEMNGQDYEFGEQITVKRLDNGNTMTFTIDDSYTYNNEGNFFTLDDVGSTIQFEVIYD